MGKVCAKKPLHLRHDKRQRAAKNQPICGLFAVAMCMGRKLVTAGDVQRFRDECMRAGVLQNRTKNWVGGTTDSERKAICHHFGFDYKATHFDLKAQTVGRLLKHAGFFKTQQTWVLCVSKHCLFVRTKKTKAKLFVMDQRGSKMHLHDDTVYMRKLRKTKLRSVCLVAKKESPATRGSA